MAQHTLFIKGLGKAVSNERSVAETLAELGVAGLCGVQIAKHRSGRSAGFAIVSFKSHTEAALALTKLDQFLLCGRRLNVRWYCPSEGSESVQQQQQQQQQQRQQQQEQQQQQQQQHAMLLHANAATMPGATLGRAPVRATITPASLNTTAAPQQQQQQQQLAVQQAAPQVLATPQPKPRAAMLDAAAPPVAPWRPLPLQVAPADSTPQLSRPVEETPSSLGRLVGMWLDNGPHPGHPQQADKLGPSTLDPVQAETPLMWRSFDDLTPCPKKRTPQQILADEISQNLDGLDLEGLPQNSSGKKKDDPGSFGKSRLLTKWGVSLHSRFADEGTHSTPAPASRPEHTHSTPLEGLPELTGKETTTAPQTRAHVPPEPEQQHPTAPSAQQDTAPPSAKPDQGARSHVPVPKTPLSSAAVPFFAPLPKQQQQQGAMGQQPGVTVQAHAVQGSAQSATHTRALSPDAMPWLKGSAHAQGSKQQQQQQQQQGQRQLSPDTASVPDQDAAAKAGKGAKPTSPLHDQRVGAHGARKQGGSMHDPLSRSASLLRGQTQLPMHAPAPPLPLPAYLTTPMAGAPTPAYSPPRQQAHHTMGAAHMAPMMNPATGMPPIDGTYPTPMIPPQPYFQGPPSPMGPAAAPPCYPGSPPGAHQLYCTHPPAMGPPMPPHPHPHTHASASPPQATPAAGFPASVAMGVPTASVPTAPHTQPPTALQQQQQQQMTAAQRHAQAQAQYAQALAALEAARSQMIAASAAFPGGMVPPPMPPAPYMMEPPFSPAAPGMAPVMGPMPPHMHGAHPMAGMVHAPPAAMVGYGGYH